MCQPKNGQLRPVHTVRFFLIAIVIPSIATNGLHRTQWKCSHYATATTSPTPMQPIVSKNKSQSQIAQCERALTRRIIAWTPDQKKKKCCDGLRWFKFKKMSNCQKDVKWSKRCQMSKSQTHGLWRRFTKEIDIMRFIHFLCQF